MILKAFKMFLVRINQLNIHILTQKLAYYSIYVNECNMMVDDSNFKNFNVLLMCAVKFIFIWKRSCLRCLSAFLLILSFQYFY